VELPATVMLALWFLTQTAGGLGSLAGMRASPVPGLIPSWAHIAGLAVGAGGVMIFRRPERQRVEWWNERPPSR
jgi:membrane associated rhomboid family serine protease